jgi:hypothetical protein
MKTNLRILLGFFCAFIILQCSNRQNVKTNHDFLVKIDNIHRVPKDSIKGWKSLLYSMDLSLINNTDSIINFWMFNCGWQENFITNFNDVRIIGALECTRNFPETYKIEKNQALTRHGLIEIPDSSYLGKDLRVGFIYIDSDEEYRLIEIEPPPPGDSISLIKHNSHKKIIWSDYFKIK